MCALAQQQAKQKQRSGSGSGSGSGAAGRAYRRCGRQVHIEILTGKYCLLQI
jgi:ribosomal protein L15